MLVLREWAQFSSPYCMSTSEFEVITVGVPVCYKELGSPVVSPPQKKLSRHSEQIPGMAE